jgi:hypothetical protein
MSITDRIRFRGKMFFSVIVPGIVLVALLVSFPAHAGAEGDASGDAKIQAMRADIMACMQPGDAGKKAREAFAKKYDVPLSKVNEKTVSQPPAGNGGWSRTTAEILCGLEFNTIIGLGVWMARASLDNCQKLKDGAQYCVGYSMYCDHYYWSRGCLKAQCSDCCQ